MMKIVNRGTSLAQHSYGFHLRSLRKQRQKSIAWVADQANLNVTYLSRVETGKRPIPAMPVRAALAVALGLTTAEIQNLENTLAGAYSIFEHASRLPGQVVVMVMNHADAQLLLTAYGGSVTFLQAK